MRLHTRLARLEQGLKIDDGKEKREFIELTHRAQKNPAYLAIVDDIQSAYCRMDTDPTLPSQEVLDFSIEGPSLEDCKKRLEALLQEVKAQEQASSG